jgi:hypothetical protein
MEKKEDNENISYETKVEIFDEQNEEKKRKKLIDFDKINQDLKRFSKNDNKDNIDNIFKKMSSKIEMKLKKENGIKYYIKIKQKIKKFPII